ncbi:MAG TPA: sn-glycerol-3-phosphate ABC transporter ATP-binding protein UgpC [Gaiellaceae bacterium]|nr:sn-glycerol-3-phosphate ABC transporter ATP-binding protein UgpC [Gaiellaceae bacterium]
MAAIWLKSVNKVYAGGVQAVHNVDLKIGSGEFMVLVGPSGCGKTTLLRMIAGLEEVTAGEIWIGDRDVTQLTPRERDIAMVFQNYALYPHMSVEQNLGYGLKVRKTDARTIKHRVGEVAKMLGLDELLDRRPAALSGGQRQRVAMGRAIVREPVAFLMDEPLSNLDAKLRVGMRAELVRLHEKLGITTVYVTHDQTEAMTLGQRVAVMRDGYLQQVDRPQRLYRHPANVFVAAFIGSPSMNLVEARVADGHAEFGGFRIPLNGKHQTGAVILGFRPQVLQDAALADPSLPSIEVVPAVIEELGSATHVIFPVDAAPVDVDAVVRAATGQGEQAVLLADDRRALFTAETGEASKAQVGVKLKLAIDPSRFHFFDPETGAALDSRDRGHSSVAVAHSPA